MSAPFVAQVGDGVRANDASDSPWQSSKATGYVVFCALVIGA